MALINITVTSNGYVAHKMLSIEHAVGALPTMLEQVVTELGQETMTALKDATPVGTGRTGGHLAESYVEETQGTTAIIGTTQPKKFRYVTEGTPERIYPLHAKALWSPELPHPMASVRGQSANPFAERVFADVQQYIDAVVPQFVEQLVAIMDS